MRCMFPSGDAATRHGDRRTNDDTIVVERLWMTGNVPADDAPGLELSASIANPHWATL